MQEKTKKVNPLVNLKTVYTDNTKSKVVHFICLYCEKIVHGGLTNIFKHFDNCPKEKKPIDEKNAKLLILLNLQ